MISFKIYSLKTTTPIQGERLMNRLFATVCGAICAILIIAIFVLGPTPALAQNQQQPRMITVPENLLSEELLDSLRAAQYQKEIEGKVKAYGWAAGLGKEIGEGVNESLKAITERTAEFAKTDVGKFTMFIVAWKIIGKDAV